MGALEVSRDTETGQDRRPPVRRPFREPWRVRGLGWPWRSGELWAAMAGPRTQEALAGQGTREAMSDRGAWAASMAGSPPPPNFIGETLPLRGVLWWRGR